ncbi:hypothetical protein sscle_08g063050 [Sclerotinia sclerotiorum 1980 UF-70]|uniref:Uncharacterized protein n=1 Tax=Sclerotinia sclerotiorum (strain ATCC 18683 / 1980 / Ss-1) TaxID=665079 RepID=A0A1D9Q9D8_SCLS1|nr:hypothetical protein sscle_08g063050 [Sclerotinia sclerotiorum 1980 UF-70]
MNFIKHELDFMTVIQQPGPFKRQRIIGNEWSVKVVEDIPLSLSIIELDMISVSDMLNTDAFQEPTENFYNYDCCV